MRFCNSNDRFGRSRPKRSRDSFPASVSAIGTFSRREAFYILLRQEGAGGSGSGNNNSRNTRVPIKRGRYSRQTHIRSPVFSYQKTRTWARNDDRRARDEFTIIREVDFSGLEIKLFVKVFRKGPFDKIYIKRVLPLKLRLETHIIEKCHSKIHWYVFRVYIYVLQRLFDVLRPIELCIEALYYRKKLQRFFRQRE